MEIEKIKSIIEAILFAAGRIVETKELIMMTELPREDIEKIIYDRSYKIIKQKFEMAVETLNAVKKVQASRQQKSEFGRFSR